MKQRHLLSLLQSGFTTVQVAFSRSDAHMSSVAPRRTSVNREEPLQHPWASAENQPPSYTYKAPLGVKPDDHVVVERNGVLSIGFVVSVDATPNIDVDADFDYKWIVQVIDKAGYQKRMDEERQFMEAVQAAEREHQRALLVSKMTEHLPPNTPARAMFDAAVQCFTGQASLPTSAPASQEQQYEQGETIGESISGMMCR